MIVCCSEEVFVLADHSKLGRVSISREYGLDAIHCLIMDSDVPEGQIKDIRNKGGHIILADA